jgi:type I restriction enzyme S subunit
MSVNDEDYPETPPRWKIPSDWRWVCISEIGKVVTGNTPPTKDESNYGNYIPFVKPPALTDKGIRSTSEGLSEAGTLSSRTVPEGAVLVSCIGGLGKTGIARVSVALNQQINAIVFDQQVIPEYGFYYAQTLKPWLYGVASATTLPIVNKGKFQRAPFPLAPVDQQESIVAEIEKQFSRLDEAVANLKRVKANLKRYKAAVLKAAVEGRLVETEAELARREGRSYETGAQLLQRILETRRSQWKGKGKYKEPAAPDTTDLPELPEGWAWASPDQLSAGEPYSLAIGPFGSSLKVSDYANSGVPLVFVRNVRAASFGGSDTVYVSLEKAADLRAHQVCAGDLLITKMGDPPGDVCIYPIHRPPAIITADCIKFRPVRNSALTQFFAYAIESDLVHKQILGITKGVAQLKVSLGRFGTIGLPLPPISEQHRIVADVDLRLSLIRGTEAQIEANLKRAERLRQSVLSDAFSGKLSRQEASLGVAA